MLARVAAIVFDKTGTLTVGRLTVTDVIAAEGVGENEVLALAAAAEQGSEHPARRSDRYAGQGARPRAAPDQRVHDRAGAGHRRDNGADGRVLLGNRTLMDARGVEVDALGRADARPRRERQDRRLPGARGQALGALAVADVLRPEAREIVGVLPGAASTS
jgi:Cu+-exporting ATPase